MIKNQHFQMILNKKFKREISKIVILPQHNLIWDFMSPRQYSIFIASAEIVSLHF
jgi:hypothetical protein